MTRVPRILVWAAILAFLPAGCPLITSSDTAGPAAGQAGSSNSGAGGSTGSGQTGPSSDNGGSTSTGGGDAGAVRPGNQSVVGGDTAGTTVPDALSVTFPDCHEPTEGAFWRAEVLRLVNQERQARGLSPVTSNTTLEDQAAEYACEMIHDRYFGHVNPLTHSTLSERATEFKYEYWIIGENLAAGQASPVAAMTDWMNSPCHRQNILNPAFTELGIGVRLGGDYGYYWVQEFGRPQSTGQYAGPPYKDPACNE